MFSVDQEYAYGTLYPDVGTKKPVVPRKVEEMFMSRDPGVVRITKRCQNGRAGCEAYKMCELRNIKPFTLPAFSPGIPGLDSDPRCLLCIRRDAKLAVVTSRYKNRPLDSAVFPFRNAVAFSGEYAPEACFMFTDREKLNGCNFFFFDHQHDMYEIANETFIHTTVCSPAVVN